MNNHVHYVSGFFAHRKDADDVFEKLISQGLPRERMKTYSDLFIPSFRKSKPVFFSDCSVTYCLRKRQEIASVIRQLISISESQLADNPFPVCVLSREGIPLECRSNEHEKNSISNCDSSCT